MTVPHVSLLVNPRSIMTGSYHNHLRVFNRDSSYDMTFEATRENITAASHVLEPINIIGGSYRSYWLLNEESGVDLCILCILTLVLGPLKSSSPRDLHVDSIDYAAKILHASWHPKRGVLALAATNNLYLFRQ